MLNTGMRHMGFATREKKGETMSDYIKREDAINLFKGRFSRLDVIKQVRALPSEDVAPVRRGHFIESERKYWEGEVFNRRLVTLKVNMCSNCGKLIDQLFENYCGNCGARMDGENGE